MVQLLRFTPSGGGPGLRTSSTYGFLRERNILVLISCRLMRGMTQRLLLPYFVLFAFVQPGGTPETLGIVASVKAIGFFVIAPIVGRLADSRCRVRAECVVPFVFI